MEIGTITRQATESAIAISETLMTPGPDLEFGFCLASLLAVLVFILTTIHAISA